MEQSQSALLRAFFEGEISGATLGEKIQKSTSFDSGGETSEVTDNPEELFIVTADNLLALCDASLQGALHPSQLETIASILISSDRFIWNLGYTSTDPVNEVIHAWDTPDINYPLTEDTVRRFRRFLKTGEKTLDEHDRDGGPLELISRAIKSYRRR